jgi:hypothetical protein
MANRGWTDSGGGGESVASTARTTGVTTQCSDGDPFTRGSTIADPNTPDGSTMGGRDDLFEVPGQLSGA